MRRLTRSALPLETVALARFLIGKLVVSEIGGIRTVGRIVEDEAYLTGDPASHAFRGPTQRNKTMFARRGHAYVYLIYGMYWCLNVSAERPGIGEAVLIRALEPLEGLAAMRRRRGGVSDRELARGPGRVCEALGIDGSFDATDLCAPRSPLRLADDGTVCALGVSTRIGLTRAAERELRFYARGSRFVSGARRLSP